MPGNPGPPPVQRVDSPTNREVAVGNLSAIVNAMNREDRYQQFLDLLGSKAAVDRWKAIALHTISTNPDLLRNADPMSVVEACRDAAVLGLAVNGLNGEGWLVLYGRQAKFQPGWQGIKKLVDNSGRVLATDVQLVYERDEFEYQLGTEPRLHHRPHQTTEIMTVVEGRGANATEVERPIIDRGKVVAAYAWGLLPSGIRIIEVMSWQEVEQVRKASPSARANRSSPWDDWWGEMARKTVLRRLMKRLPKSTAVEAALQLDAEADRLREEAIAASPVATAREKALAALAARTVTSDDEPHQPPAADPPQTDGVVVDLTGQAGGAVAEQPESTVVCGATREDMTGPCLKDPGHDGLHRNEQKETWQ